ncbi:unnamed protein product [Amoebophrya sp. A25]|nr:unnamed protein product [Amoebophrya sp. A25]|eukprot:GSA25T00020297001.1
MSQAFARGSCRLGHERVSQRALVSTGTSIVGQRGTYAVAGCGSATTPASVEWPSRHRGGPCREEEYYKCLLRLQMPKLFAGATRGVFSWGFSSTGSSSSSCSSSSTRAFSSSQGSSQQGSSQQGRVQGGSQQGSSQQGSSQQGSSRVQGGSQQDDYFTILGLPQRYLITREELDLAFRKTQKRFHPDVIAHLPDVERLPQEELSMRANEAARVLRSPLERARYFIRTELYKKSARGGPDKGVEASAIRGASGTSTTPSKACSDAGIGKDQGGTEEDAEQMERIEDSSLLLELMEKYEILDEATTAKEVADVRTENEENIARAESKIQEYFESLEGDAESVDKLEEEVLAGVRVQIEKLSLYNRLTEKIRGKEDELGEK